jgi:hypothetical protein
VATIGENENTVTRLSFHTLIFFWFGSLFISWDRLLWLAAIQKNQKG